MSFSDVVGRLPVLSAKILTSEPERPPKGSASLTTLPLGHPNVKMDKSNW